MVAVALGSQIDTSVHHLESVGSVGRNALQL